MATAIEDITDCPICWNTFEQPLALICNHTICKKCATKIRKHQQVKCPKCNQVSHESQIKPDFRLTQFLDALTQQAKELTDPHEETPETDIPETAKCELCGSKLVTCICEDCEQSMCGDCRVIHKRSKASMEHRVVPVSNKAEEIKKRLTSLVDHFNHLKTANEIILQQGVIAESQAEATKTETFENIDTACDTMIDEIHKLSEHLKSQIADILNASLDEVNARKQDAMANLDVINAKLEQANHMLEVDNVELVTSGFEDIEDLEDGAKEIKEVEKVPSIPDIHVKQLPSFQLSKVLTLDISTKRKDLYIASEQYDHLMKENRERRFSDPGFRKTPSSRKVPVPQRKWMRQQVFSLTQHHSSSVYNTSMRLMKKHLYGKATSKDLRAIRAFNDHLYICSKEAIRVFDGGMNHVRDISFHVANDVATFHTDHLLVACDTGLYTVDGQGQIAQLMRGKFHKLQVLDGKIYVSTGHDASVHMFETIDGALVKKKTYSTPHERQKITFTVSPDLLIICAYDFMDQFRIYEMNLEGEIIKMHVHPIRSSFLIEYPILCERWEDRTVLIIVNGRLKMIDTSRQLKSLDMEPRMKSCVHAVKLSVFI